MNTTYKVVFKFEGPIFEIPFVKETAQELFIELYNEFCNETNPNYEIWNKRFEDSHPDHKVKADDPEDLYNKYIREIHRDICNAINGKYKHLQMKLKVDRDYSKSGNVYGELRHFPGNLIWFVIET